MKIAMLTYSTKPRGGVVHALNLSESLSRLGCKVHIFSLSKEKNPQFFRKVLIPHTIFNYIPDNRSYSTPEEKAVANVEIMIQKYVEKLPRNFDIYHTQDCVGAVALNRLKKAGLKAPTVRTIHHIDIYNEYRLQKFQEESVYDCDIKLVVSKYWQKYVKKNYGISTDITYNGVDSKRFEGVNSNEILAKNNLNGKKVILFIGGLEPRKGLEYLILAMENIVKQHTNAVLVAIARSGLIDSGEKAWFNMLIKRLRLNDSVKLIDYVEEDEIPVYYASADVYVMPSRMEGWGLGLMEAMASSKPVVATRTGGIPELVKNNKNGILVEPGNIYELSEAICKLLNSGELMLRLGQFGRNEVKKYTWEKTADRIMKTYKNILKKQ